MAELKEASFVTEYSLIYDNGRRFGMKKTILVFILLFTVVFAGCGKNKEESIMENNSLETLKAIEFSEQNENTIFSDIPTIDESSTQQIANAENDKSLVMDKVNISLEDIKRQTLVFYVENLSGEGIVID